MTRRLTESGSFAHAKYHDLQYGRARKKVIGNRASAQNQGDVKEPPNQTGPNYGNDNGSGGGVLGASDFLADMPVDESGYRTVQINHTYVRYGVIICHSLKKSL